MKALVASLGLLLLGAAPPETRPIYAGMPPARYMGDAAAITLYVSDVEAYCFEATPGYVMVGCAKTIDGVPHMILLNPCLFPEELYATIACHEKAHAAFGWPSDHPY